MWVSESIGKVHTVQFAENGKTAYWRVVKGFAEMKAHFSLAGLHVRLTLNVFHNPIRDTINASYRLETTNLFDAEVDVSFLSTEHFSFISPLPFIATTFTLLAGQLFYMDAVAMPLNKHSQYKADMSAAAGFLRDVYGKMSSTAIEDVFDTIPERITE